MSVKQILRWTDEHKRRTGAWPTAHSGPIVGTNGETWLAVQSALHTAIRGFPGGSSLAQVLATYRRVRNRKGLPHLAVAKILKWADAHYARTKRWPREKSGPVLDAPGETWGGINAALRDALRGLPGGTTLAKLLARERGVFTQRDWPKYSVAKVLKWALRHYRRTGKWPKRSSGEILDAPGETWYRVSDALTQGHRGLPGGSSLA